MKKSNTDSGSCSNSEKSKISEIIESNITAEKVAPKTILRRNPTAWNKVEAYLKEAKTEKTSGAEKPMRNKTGNA
jgi:hypothetical protein